MSLNRFLTLFFLALFCFSQLVISSVYAQSADQRTVYDRSSLWYDVGCEPGATSSDSDSSASDSIPGETTGPPKLVKKIIWDTLTGGGIDALHTAAVMGNINEEGVWNPMSTELAANIPGDESKDPHVVGSYGYGLIGWTPGTRLLDSMKEAGIKGKPYTAETQAAVILAHIKGETPSQYSPDVGKYFLKTKNIEDATTAYQGTSSRKGFENPADPVGSLQDRISAAKRFLRHFGGGPVGTGTTTDTSTSGSSASAECVCPTSSGPASGTAALTGKTNAEKIFNYLVDNAQLTDNQAAGAVGSMMLESGGNTLNLDPTATNPSSGAYGIAQWLDSRLTALEDYADKHGSDKSNLAMQAGYLLQEMKDGINAFDLTEFKKTKTLPAASKYWTNWFEGLAYSPGQQLHDDRLDNARLLLNHVDEDGPSSDTTAAAASGDCECSIDSANTVIGDRLKQLAKENGGKTQIAVSSLDGGMKGNYGGSIQMPTRSSYKIYTAYATLKAIEDGKISWSSQTSYGQSVEATMKAMIINSNNDAAEALRTDGRIGDYKYVTNLLQNKVGLSSKTVMGNGNYSSVSGTNSQSTANDFDRFLIQLAKHKLPGVTKKEDYDKLIAYMKQATTDEVSARDGIAAGVGSGVDVADKPGWASGSDPASNDVGIVYLKGNTYVLSILTDKPYQWDGVAHIAGEVNKMMGGASPDDANACAGAVPGDLTATVKGYAWPNYSSSRSDPKQAYKKAFDDAKSRGQYFGGGYTDCGAFVTRVMIDSGYEPNYNFGGKVSAGAGPTNGGQIEWLRANWQKIAVSSTNDLKPGDVAISSSHTYMYVGVLSGFHGNSASASLGGRVPMASDYYEDGFTWYRKK